MICAIKNIKYGQVFIIMSDQITTFILSHTNELCATVIPSMENSLVKDVTSAIEIQDYTITITISKQKVLGKRRYETPISSRSIIQNLIPVRIIYYIII